MNQIAKASGKESASTSICRITRVSHEVYVENGHMNYQAAGSEVKSHNQFHGMGAAMDIKQGLLLILPVFVTVIGALFMFYGQFSGMSQKLQTAEEKVESFSHHIEAYSSKMNQMSEEVSLIKLRTDNLKATLSRLDGDLRQCVLAVAKLEMMVKTLREVEVSRLRKPIPKDILKPIMEPSRMHSQAMRSMQ